jgi:hypothetical protein
MENDLKYLKIEEEEKDDLKFINGSQPNLFSKIMPDLAKLIICHFLPNPAPKPLPSERWPTNQFDLTNPPKCFDSADPSPLHSKN